MNNEMFSKMSPACQSSYKENARELLEYLRCQFNIELDMSSWFSGSTFAKVDNVVDSIGKSEEYFQCKSANITVNQYRRYEASDDMCTKILKNGEKCKNIVYDSKNDEHNVHQFLRHEVEINNQKCRVHGGK